MTGAMLMSQTGCASTPLTLLTAPRTSMESQVFLRPAFIGHHRSKLVIYPFTHPRYAPRTGTLVTQEFYQELLRSGLYRQIVLASQIPRHAGETSNTSGFDDYDLAMRGKIVHLLAGSGNTPSQLTVEVQIMSAATETLVWYVRLDGTSETGVDIDLVWHTYEGQGALPYQALARALAQQLVKVMTPPAEPETQTVPRKSPLSAQPIDTET